MFHISFHFHNPHLHRTAALDKKKMDYDVKVKTQYEDLLKDAERLYHTSLEEREKQRAAQEREKDRLIQQLRQDIDLMKVKEVDEVEARVRERAAELTRQLEGEKQEYLGVVDAERERREAAERNITTLQQELDKITYSMNQWKLELHKSLVSKYENLFNEVQARSRKDREAFARKLLEEEEKRLARELVRKDNELTRNRTEVCYVPPHTLGRILRKNYPYKSSNTHYYNTPFHSDGACSITRM